MLQINKQAQKSPLALISNHYPKFVLDQCETVWLSYQLIKQWPVPLTCGMWPVKYPRPKFSAILTIVFSVISSGSVDFFDKQDSKYM